MDGHGICEAVPSASNSAARTAACLFARPPLRALLAVAVSRNTAGRFGARCFSTWGERHWLPSASNARPARFPTALPAGLGRGKLHRSASGVTSGLVDGSQRFSMEIDRCRPAAFDWLSNKKNSNFSVEGNGHREWHRRNVGSHGARAVCQRAREVHITARCVDHRGTGIGERFVRTGRFGGGTMGNEWELIARACGRTVSEVRAPQMRDFSFSVQFRD
jgi:hypothetical protein